MTFTLVKSLELLQSMHLLMDLFPLQLLDYKSAHLLLMELVRPCQSGRGLSMSECKSDDFSVKLYLNRPGC